MAASSGRLLRELEPETVNQGRLGPPAGRI